MSAASGKDGIAVGNCRGLIPQAAVISEASAWLKTVRHSKSAGLAIDSCLLRHCFGGRSAVAIGAAIVAVCLGCGPWAPLRLQTVGIFSTDDGAQRAQKPTSGSAEADKRPTAVESTELPRTHHEDRLNEEVRKVLARAWATDSRGRRWSVWSRAPDDKPPRWRYGDLERLIALPETERPDFRMALQSSDLTLSGNAAIAQGRLGDASVAPRLAAVVRSSVLPTPMRCAAVEVLGNLPDVAAREQFRGLLHEFLGNEQSASRCPPELAAELLWAGVSATDAGDEPIYRRALAHRAPEVRAAAVARWRTDGNPPKELFSLHADSDPRVRIAVIEVIGRSGGDEGVDRCLHALNDVDLKVRLAAIDALGKQRGDPRAREALRRFLKSNHSELTRSAAVSALIAGGWPEEALMAVDDPSWRVREALARGLADVPFMSAGIAAKRLICDPSPRVQQALISALERLPIEVSDEVLLEALDSSVVAVRHEAARVLAKHWQPAEVFPVDSSPDRRAEALAQLRTEFRRWRQERSGGGLSKAADQAEADCKLHQLQQRRQRDQAAEVQIEKLGSPDVVERRRAAAELARSAAEFPLPHELIERIYQRSAAEPDVLVWQNLLRAVARGGPAAHQLAYVGLTHPAADVRRSACRLLEDDPSPSHRSALMATLDDRHNGVVAAALRALAAGGGIDDTQPIRKLLASSNAQVCFEAAHLLAVSNDPSGFAALERLAYADDPNIQRQTAEVMGRLARREFVAALIQMLDGPVSVQRAALEALPRCAGEDVVERPEATAEKAGRCNRNEAWNELASDSNHGDAIGDFARNTTQPFNSPSATAARSTPDERSTTHAFDAEPRNTSERIARWKQWARQHGLR